MKACQKHFVFIDTETTGLDFLEHEIIQVAIIRESYNSHTKKWEVYKWQTRIKPQYLENASPTALDKNGYSANPSLWDNAPTFEQVVDDIQYLMKDAIIIGQNIGFDLRFLETQMRPLGKWDGIGHHSIDTATLALEHLLPAKIHSVSLKNVCKLIGIKLENHHDAMADIEATRQVFYKLVRASFVKRLWWRIKRPFVFPSK